MSDLVVFADEWTTLSGQRICISRLVDQWLYERSPHTKDAYLRDMRLFVQYMGTVNFDRVTPDQMLNFAMSLQGYASLNCAISTGETSKRVRMVGR
jgi:hypothetical protein